MAYASLATRGYGADGSIALVVRAGFTGGAIPAESLATFGFGQGSSLSSCLTGGYSLYVGVPIIKPAGKQYVVVAGLPWTGRSILEGADPAVANGDLIICDLVSTPDGYAITMNPDGTFSVAVGGNTARQSFVCDVYSLSLSGFYGEFTTTVNNQVPTQTAGIVLSALTVGSAMTPLDLSAFVIDAEGDALTYSVAPGSDPLPAGLTLVGSVISGTPTATTLRNVVIRVTDSVGDYLDLPSIAMGPAEAVESATSGRWYGVDLETGQWSVMELGSIPSTALAVVIDYNAIGSKPGDRNRAINALKALQYYLLRSPWPPV